MNDQDKILLSSYLDNALTSAEEDYVETLTANDEDALNYLNNLKEVNNRVNSYFEDSLNSKEAKEFNNFMETLGEKESDLIPDIVTDNQQGSLVTSLKKFIFPQAIAGYVLSGFLFFNIGSIQYAGNIDEGSLLAEFSYSKPIVNSYLKYRGLDQDDSSKHIEETLNQMIDEKVGLADITYGSTPFSIEIKEKALNQNEFECYKGSVVSKEVVKDFLFCKSSENSSLILE